MNVTYPHIRDASGNWVQVGRRTSDARMPVSIEDGTTQVVVTAGGALKIDGSAAPQPVTDNSGSLTIDSTQLPAALVGGRLDVNIGAGSLAVTEASLDACVQVNGSAVPADVLMVGVRDAAGNAARLQGASDGDAITAGAAGNILRTVAQGYLWDAAASAWVRARGSAKGTQAASALATQDLKDSGRQAIAITIAAAASTTAEGAMTMTRSVAFGATATGASFQVSAGKKFRIQAIQLNWITAGTASNIPRISLRAAVGATANTASPLQWSMRFPLNTQTWAANQGDVWMVDFPEGFELDAAVGYCLTQSSTVAGGAVDIALIGYEY